MKIITKYDTGSTIEVKLHELFAVELDTTHAQNEFLAVPAFIQEQNFEIIKEYSYAAPKNATNIQSLGKKIFLLMATQVNEVDLSWYNLSTAKEELHFHLKVSLKGSENTLKIANHISDSDNLGMPDSVCRS